MIRKASPIALAPVEQAMQGADIGPLRRLRIETVAGAILMSPRVTKNGSRARGPFLIRFEQPFSMLEEPPIPEPMMTPLLSPSMGECRSPQSSKANSDAATAKWVKRSIGAAAFLSIHRSGSKSLTSAATLDG